MPGPARSLYNECLGCRREGLEKLRPEESGRIEPAAPGPVSSVQHIFSGGMGFGPFRGSLVPVLSFDLWLS